MNTATTLIATLGTEPQVVTATLDLLFQMGEKVDEVVVVHTHSSDPRITKAIRILEEAFEDDQNKRGIHLNLLPVGDDRGIVADDVRSPNETQAFFRTLYKRVRIAKHAGRKIHISIAGGRKTMAVFAMVTAQLLFDENDRLWHLYSEGDFLESKRLWPGSDDIVQLIPIPVILWSNISPVFVELSDIEDPFEAAERFQHLKLQEKLEKTRAYLLGVLSGAEYRVVSLFVTEGLSDNELAERLFLSPRTVEQHLRSAYAKAANHWELSSVTRAQLIALLNWYFVAPESENLRA